MGHSVGDGIIVLALAAAFVAYLYFKHRERQRRLEIIHQERMAAMDKGIPLPELPLDPPAAPSGRDPGAVLMQGIVWLALGVGGMITLAFIPAGGGLPALWPMPLPLALLGTGLILYHVLTSDRAR